MNKVKRLLNKVIISFALLGCLTLGAFFVGNLNQSSTKIANAEIAEYGEIKNNLPEYFKIKTPEKTDPSSAMGKVGNTIYLFQPNSEKEIVIAEDFINGANKQEKNYAFAAKDDDSTEEDKHTQYYYFDFQSSLSLYYDLTNTDIQNGETGKNLLAEVNISNFAKSYFDNNGTDDETDDVMAFAPKGYSFKPQQFNIKFKLDSTLEQISPKEDTITLDKEGCYTLSIPVSVYSTDNNGETFVLSETTIYYTFMAFKADTYFNELTGRPNISVSDNLQTSYLNQTSAYSTYYFYNFAYGKSVNTLPTVSYNPERFKLRIVYADIDQQTHVSDIVYKNGNIILHDESGKEIEQSKQIIHANINKNGKVVLAFTEIGSYDIIVNYVYHTPTGAYAIPLENLDDSIIFNNKPQKLYVYGYQTVYSDYSTPNPDTNQPETKELKTFDFENSRYENSADITSAVNDYIIDHKDKNSKPEHVAIAEMQNPSSNTIFDSNDSKPLKEYSLRYIRQENVQPVTTNQTPVKFLTNAKLQSSYIYNVTTDSAGSKILDDGEPFQGFNQNKAGTYLYIIQYTFDSFMSENGISQKDFYHYQIFYFTVTNTTPTVTVYDETFSEIYTGGFTNKSVYVLNDSENNIYDAKVDITLSAYNYQSKSYYFGPTNINDLSQYGIKYELFEEASKDTDDYQKYNEKIAGKRGILINNASFFANSLFTIQVKSKNSEKPSTRTFTIDTNPIENITSRNALLTSSTSYKVDNSFDGYATNRPFILSWDEKASEATTYGYIKFIPFTSINYYSSLNENNVANLLSRLVEHETLPVSYKIDIKEAASSWIEYSNTSHYTSMVPATNVKSNDGIYILEVYDQAGNSAFDIFMKDSTSPIFIQKIRSNLSTVRKLFSNNETISVPESSKIEISIEWSKNKAIYLENLDEIQNFTPYQYGIDTETAKIKLQEVLSNFFEIGKNNNLKSINDIIVNPNTTASGTYPTTELTSYNGTYLLIPINDRAYFKDTKSNDYSPYDNNHYQITFIDENDSAIEGTYKILIRDDSNTYFSNEELNYKLNPSAYLSFNVTSDASKMMIRFDDAEVGETLSYSSYSMVGDLYYYTDEYGKTQYTHLSNNGKEKTDPDYIDYEETNPNLSYKFMYHTPIKATRELYLSFIPFANNGSKLSSIVLKYYRYEKKCLTKNGNSYYYYDIEENPYRTINVFTQSDKVYEQGVGEFFSIALGSDSYPLTGRYVIERIYLEGNDTDKYDFFKRTISFTVDDFNLISPLESISNNDVDFPKSSLESIVGSDIILSMYSGEGLSSLEVSFPSYNEYGLNSGSFYTKDSFDEYEDLAIYAVNGNKLPMSLYIPKHKYTTSTNRKITDKDKTDYSVEKNDNLSYYGNATYKQNSVNGDWDVYVEGVVVASFPSKQLAELYIINNISITEYEIFVEIRATIVENNKNVTKYYYSNGTSVNGYLAIYLGDENGNIVESNPTEFFYHKGHYVVTIYQSNNDPQSSFRDFYRFGFEIISQEPDFLIYGSDNYELQQTNINNTYFTNSDLLTIKWEVPTNKYQAKIDEKNINISYSHSSTVSVTVSDISDEKGIKSFTIDTSQLVLMSNSYIEITMQYEGFDDDYYDPITKRVYFDSSAPIQNLTYLMTLTENATNSAFPLKYQQLSMRKYYDHHNEEIDVTEKTDLANISYTYSLNNGYFKYFSYNVTKDFFNNTLKSYLANASTSPYDTQFIYYKDISNIDSYTQVDKLSFAQGNYKYLDTSIKPQLSCGYYEVVEMDYAGNMTVYIVYVIDSDLTEDSNVSNEALSYINNKHDSIEPILNEQIVEGFNIYSNSGFELTNLNYKSDPWALMTVNLSGKTSSRYMKSPWLEENSIYKVSFTTNGIMFEEMSLSQVFKGVDSSSSKHQLVFTDRTTGSNTLVYLSIMDTSINTQKIEDPNKTSAILNISIPNETQFHSTTLSYAYPVQITIKQFDKALQGTGVEPWTPIMVANQTSYGVWEAINDIYNTAFEYISFKIVSGNTLQIVINLGENASQKIRYEIIDNFGNSTIVIQLANEISYKEVSGDSNIYQLTESDTSITYVSSSTIRYSYNTLLYNVAVYNRKGDDITHTIEKAPNATTNITVISFMPSNQYIYDDYYRLEIRDVENPADKEPKIIHIRVLYNLPFYTTTASEVVDGGIVFNDKNQNAIKEDYVNKFSSLTVKFNNIPYTSSGYAISSYDNVTIKFKNGQDYAYKASHHYDYGYTYSVYLSSDNGQTWENINSDTSAIGGYTITNIGEYLILVKYDSEDVFTNLCKIFTVSVIDQNLYPLYSIRVDNLPVEKSNIKYQSTFDNIEYEINYIVGVDYADKDNRLTILENEEKGVEVTKYPRVESTGTNVQVEIYSYTSKIGLSGSFTIIYIAETNNIVSTFTYDSPAGTTVPLKDTSTVMVVADKETGTNFDTLKLNFSAYYGIEGNKINVEVLKLFNGVYTNIDCKVYQVGEYAYITLERAGSYRIKVYDSCTPANVQLFKGSKYIDVVFLSTVPFVVSHTDENGNSITTEPIQKAVYNSDVIIELVNVYSQSYYQRTPKISVLFNGREYTNYKTQNNTYTFTAPGFYTVKFSAQSETGVEIREEEFNFTILKKNEIRYAYELTQYGSYYIEKVEKDGIDITDDLVNLGNFKTIYINNDKYLANLTLSHSLTDEKTGDGRYKITVNLNNDGYSNVIGNTFTFELRIGFIKSLPINVSIAEGETTSDDITVSFNVQNLYNAVGDCYIIVGNIIRYYTSETLANYGEIEILNIVGEGTHYIQVYTLSGRPIYSYKVIKTQPLNAFAIIAIIVGIMAVIAVIIITIKIRKRQKAK